MIFPHTSTWILCLVCGIQFVITKEVKSMSLTGKETKGEEGGKGERETEKDRVIQFQHNPFQTIHTCAYTYEMSENRIHFYIKNTQSKH